MPSSPKFFYPRSSSSSRRSILLIVSILLGIAGLFIILVAVSRQSSGYKCKYSKLRSVSVVWDKGSNCGNGVILDGNQKRYKIMGFVGIQTGFGSAGRRKSLGQSWFPNDLQSLQRLEESTGLAFKFIIGRTNDILKMLSLKQESGRVRRFPAFGY